MNTKIDRGIDRQTDREIDRDIHMHMCIHTNKHTHTQTHTHTHTHTPHTHTESRGGARPLRARSRRFASARGMPYLLNESIRKKIYELIQHPCHNAPVAAGTAVGAVTVYSI